MLQQAQSRHRQQQARTGTRYAKRPSAVTDRGYIYSHVRSSDASISTTVRGS